MANPEAALRNIVDETVQERRDQAQACLARHDPEALPVARTHLLYLWDEYRTELLDFAAFSSPVGHNNDRVTNTVADHLRYYGYTAPQGRHLLRWPVAYAQALSEAFTGLDEEPRQVLFCEGEREAVDQAVRLARWHNQRPHLAVLDTGQHDWLVHADRLPVDPVLATRLDWDKRCALLLSPVTDRGVLLDPQTVRSWIQQARDHEVPVIVDETVSGFGRTGTLWGQEHAGLVADLTVLGGPCGGGLPLGAVIADRKYFQAPLDVSGQSGHPWACAAGNAVLDSVHPGVLAHVEDSARHLTTALDGLVGQFPTRLAGHHGHGLLRGLRFVSPDDARRFPLSARSHGLHLAPAVGDTVLLAPVLISSSHEVTRGVDVMAEVLMSWEDC